MKGSSSSSEENEDGRDVAGDKKSKVEEKLERLKRKHAGTWPEFKLRTWAHMLVLTLYFQLIVCQDKL